MSQDRAKTPFKYSFYMGTTPLFAHLCCQKIGDPLGRRDERIEIHREHKTLLAALLCF